MRTIKRESTLRLELDSILEPKAIQERSKVTLNEAYDELLIIANNNFLTIKNDWAEIKRIYDAQNLNK